MIPKIDISDYNYNLPDERIAKFPLEVRDQSKLLLYNCETLGENSKIASTDFASISKILPDNSLMIFNNTKVVPARLFFKRDTGAVIEVFCLEPDTPSDYQLNFASTSSCRWKVIIGNIKRFKSDKIKLLISRSALSNDDDLEHINLLKEIDLQAELISRDGNSAVVEFTWQQGLPFSKVLELCGKIPIPPYLKRETQEIDYQRYQTLYAKIRGSVAAPTAGLHFTENVLKEIKERGIISENVCLHVGAGTFLPVKSQFIEEHKMHTEPFSVSLAMLKTLHSALSEGKPIISVGTTSTRTLESLYFIGVHCIETGTPSDVEQWEPYREEGYSYSSTQSIFAIIKYLEDNNLKELISRTGIIIVPGYKFNIIDYLVTNFHQPQSTLLLLISAFVGEGNWQKIYDYALANGFRFLSYGDSSLLKRVG